MTENGAGRGWGLPIVYAGGDVNMVVTTGWGNYHLHPKGVCCYGMGRAGVPNIHLRDRESLIVGRTLSRGCAAAMRIHSIPTPGNHLPRNL